MMLAAVNLSWATGAPLSLLTLALGAAAVVLPALALCASGLLRRRLTQRGTGAAALASFACCCASLLCVLLYLRNETAAGDFAAVADTIGAFLFCSVVLVVLTVVLNAALLVRRTR